MGSFVFAEGTFDSTNLVLTATNRRMGQPKFDGGQEVFAMMGGAGGLGHHDPADHGGMGGFGGPGAMGGNR